MSPREALATATRNATRVIGFEDSGTLEPGKLADLIILGENPLERIRAITEPGTVEAVLQGGEVMSGSLDGLGGASGGRARLD